MTTLNKVSKNGRIWVLWSDISKDFSESKNIVYGLFGDVEGDHGINMDFHFELTASQFRSLEKELT